jgi:hypothetical protein
VVFGEKFLYIGGVVGSFVGGEKKRRRRGIRCTL